MRKVWRPESRLNFWPAYADLMIVIGIVGLISFAAIKPTPPPPDGEKREPWEEEARGVISNIYKVLIDSKIIVRKKADGIQLPESILKFDSGRVEPVMDANGQNIFEKICFAIKSSIDKIPDGDQKLCVVIEGHTDSQPIGSELAKFYATNWELSAARATRVLRMMCSDPYRLDYDHYQMRALGFGDKQPIEKGEIISEVNRRIEIKILPNYERIKER